MRNWTAHRVLRGHHDCACAKELLAKNDGARRVLRSHATETKLAGAGCPIVGHFSIVRDVCFAPDSRKVVTVSNDKTMLVWDLDSAEVTQRFTFNAPVIAAAFSPDGLQVAAGSGSDVCFWTVGSRDKPVPATGTTHKGLLACLTFAPDGALLATGSQDKCILLWDTKSRTHVQTMAGHTGMVACLGFCPTGRTLASGSWDCNVVVWEVKSGVPSAILKGHNGCDGCTCEVNPLAQAKLAAQCVIRGHAHFVNSLCWSADARVLISAGADGAIIFWDVSANVPLRTISGKAWRSVRLSADGALLAAAGANDLVQIWPADPDTGTFDGPLATLQGHAGAITALNFSSSGLLASASYDSSCIVWTQGVHDGSLGTCSLGTGYLGTGKTKRASLVMPPD
jgi:WD40 repeat protein